jgi:hypothetical protein
LTEAEQEVADEYALNVELYQKHELPCFLKEMELWGSQDLTGDQYLKALDILFWSGLYVTHHGIPDIPVGRFTPEIAMILDQAVQERKVSKKTVARILGDVYLEAYEAKVKV